jgi:hypothetical protein
VHPEVRDIRGDCTTGICCFGDLPVSASNFNIRALAEVFQAWGGAMIWQHAKTSIRVAQLFSCAGCGLALLTQGAFLGGSFSPHIEVKSRRA